MTLSLTNPPRPQVLGCLFAHEVLRRLGYPADWIYVAQLNATDTTGAGGRCAVIILSPRGPDAPEGQRFVWIIGTSSIPDDQFAAEWSEAVDFWNAYPKVPDLLEAWGFAHARIVVEEAPRVPAALRRKGLAVPGPELRGAS
jgi:hypothetical protein